jgi:hypothetical protein
MEILREFQRLLCEQKAQVTSVITREAGKPRAEALATEILVVLDYVNYLVEAVPEFLRSESVRHTNPIMKLKSGALPRALWRDRHHQSVELPVQPAHHAGADRVDHRQRRGAEAVRVHSVFVPGNAAPAA